MSGLEGMAQSSAPSGPSLSHLPWNMIPAFKPGETEINEYTKKIEFLAGLWPPEHLSHLAPRAAMLCEGSSFKRIMRLDPTKLKVNSLDGVKLLVSTLGGIWGKSNLEDKFERFERAIFSTVQRQDESHESYLARHDYQFEELLQMGVGFNEVRAYILLRNSGLGSEDKKKLIVDAKGELEYKSIVSSLKLLGSKFFHEVQTGNRSLGRNKTYDVNAVFDEDPQVQSADDETAFMGESWDDYEIQYDDSDPDAVVRMQFEENLVEALQCDSELAACYNTYLDARKRLADKGRNRGFWNPKGYAGYQKGKSKGKSKGMFKGRKPLAQRILESECRRCGMKGHWKAECPLNKGSSAATSTTGATNSAFAGTVTVLSADATDQDMIVVNSQFGDVPRFKQIPSCSQAMCFVNVGDQSMGRGILSPQAISRFLSSLKHRLSPQHESQSEPCGTGQPTPVTDVAMFVSHGPYGIMDLGASQTVIGSQQVNSLLSNLPSEIQSRVQKVPCQTVFRFGNSSTVMCQQALMIPLGAWMVKVCVVNSQTPFLLSNNVFRTLGAQIDTAQDVVYFAKLGFSMDLTLSEKKLYLIDFCELVKRSFEISFSGSKVPDSAKPVMLAASDAFQDSVEETQKSNPCSDDRDQPSPVAAFNRPSGLVQSVSDRNHGLKDPCRSVLRSGGDQGERGVHEDVDEELSQMRISFGETKLNQKFIDVIEQDPKYVKWFSKKYAESQKKAHQAFLYFLNLYVERLELTQEGITMGSTKFQAVSETLKPKSKCAPKPSMVSEDISSWSEDELERSWSVEDEVSQQGQRLNNMEATMSQIANQLQILTQMITTQPSVPQ